jgi:hypothetical protein
MVGASDRSSDILAVSDMEKNIGLSNYYKYGTIGLSD